MVGTGADELTSSTSGPPTELIWRAFCVVGTDMAVLRAVLCTVLRAVLCAVVIVGTVFVMLLLLSLSCTCIGLDWGSGIYTF